MIPLLLTLFLWLRPAPVLIDVYTRYVMVNNQVRVRTRIIPDVRNRQLVVEWFQYPGFEDRKYYQLDGDQGPLTREFYVTMRETGVWTFAAVLVKNDGQDRDTTTATVLGPGYTGE